MTLTSDLVFRIFMSLAPLLYYICGRNPIFGVCMHLGMSNLLYHPGVTVNLTSDLVSGMGIESGAYILYSLR